MMNKYNFKDTFKMMFFALLCLSHEFGYFIMLLLTGKLVPNDIRLSPS
jgi:hypothetical protein